MLLVLLQISTTMPRQAPEPCDSLLGVASTRVVDTLGDFSICLPGRYNMKIVSGGHVWSGAAGSSHHPPLGVEVVDDSASRTLQAQSEFCREPINTNECDDYPRIDSVAAVYDSAGIRPFLIETAQESGTSYGFDHIPYLQIMAARPGSGWVIITIGGTKEEAGLIALMARSLQWTH